MYLKDLAMLLPRQYEGDAGHDHESPASEELVNACGGEAVDLTNMPLRIASIFIILVASLFGAVLPILLNRTTRMHVPKMTFFVFKYVGTGVIIATAWMHLLSPAVELLHNECLHHRLGDYDWAFAIGLMTVMAMFLVELLASRYGTNKLAQSHGHGHGHPAGHSHALPAQKAKYSDDNASSGGSPTRSGGSYDEKVAATTEAPATTANSSQGPTDGNRSSGFFHGPNPEKIPGLPNDVSYPPGGDDHLGHARGHVDGDSHTAFAGQLTAIFILEFGVVFHSVFIGLALSTSSNLVILLVVITFHQFFEGLGLGSRLALARWGVGRRWWPYFLALLYGLSTPLAIAIGLAARPSSAENQILVNGIFDAISAGILMYTGLVELLAHEFMFNEEMRQASLGVQLFAYGCVALGAGVMALLANWA